MAMITITCTTQEELTQAKTTMATPNEGGYKLVVSGDEIVMLNAEAFKDCTELFEVDLNESSIITIGDSCFQGCTSLTLFSLNFGIESIGIKCFQGCTELLEIIIPNSLSSLGSYCFADSGLAMVTIGSSLLKLPSYCFINCTNLTSVRNTSHLTSIGIGCFQGCTTLVNIELGDNLTFLGSSAFIYCTFLKSIKIPKSLTEISTNCFYQISLLGGIDFSEAESLETIGLSAFGGCRDLSSVEIPASVKSLMNSCFNNCSKLESIKFLGNVNTIGLNFAYSCPALKDVTYLGDTEPTTVGNNAFPEGTIVNVPNNYKSETFGSYAINRMAPQLVKFYKGIAANYNAADHGNGIYQCTDTGDTYIFGVKNSGSGGTSDVIDTTGDGSKFLANDGTYKDVNIDTSDLATKSELNSKADSVHTHTIEQVTDLQTTLDGKASSSHSHSISEVTDLSSQLDTKLSVSNYNSDKETFALKSEIPSLSGYATETWVNKQGFAKTSQIPSVPTNISSFTNDSGYQTSSQVDSRINEIIGSAPAALDTLEEIAEALNNDPDFASSITTLISQKADKSEIPSLSGYATQSWVNSQGFLKSVPSEYVTETELNGKGYATTSALNSGLSGKANSNHTHSADQVSGLASVAKSGSYNDLTNKPTIPSIPSIAAFSSQGNYVTDVTASGHTIQVTKKTLPTYSLGTFGVSASANELNYVKGVTSPIQTQLNSKASSSHTHTALTIRQNGSVKGTYTGGSAVTIDLTDNNTTYGVATSSSNGLMSSSDKAKLDGMASLEVIELPIPSQSGSSNLTLDLPFKINEHPGYGDYIIDLLLVASTSTVGARVVSVNFTIPLILAGSSSVGCYVYSTYITSSMMSSVQPGSVNPVMLQCYPTGTDGTIRATIPSNGDPGNMFKSVGNLKKIVVTIRKMS